MNTKSFEIKTPDVTIKVAPDKTYLVENRMIDGRPCLVIAINEHVEINGISVRPVPLADRKTAGEGQKIQHHGKKKMVHRILSDLMRSVRWQRGSALQMKYKKKRILPLVL